MSLGGQGNNNPNLPNLAITGSLPPDERRKRWLWIAQQCTNIINYADQGDNPNNIGAWPEAYSVMVVVLKFLDSLDPERSQPTTIPPQHPGYPEPGTQSISHNQPRINTPLPEPLIHTYIPHSDVIPKMPSVIGYSEYQMRPPVPRNASPAQNYIFNRSNVNAPQNTGCASSEAELLANQ